MSHLRIFADNDANTLLLATDDASQISIELAQLGVRFSRWHSERALADNASNEEILAAYQPEIDKLVAQEGYQSYDVVSMNPDHPQKAEFRAKFLAEHTHSEDEVRFFVRGQGLFFLHVGNKVYEVLCCQDDLISVPANATHWFDMGPQPRFTAIRLFNNPEGWVANFTGSEIAQQFPKLEA